MPELLTPREVAQCLDIMRQAMSIAGKRSAAARKKRMGVKAYQERMKEMGKRGGIAARGKPKPGRPKMQK